MTMTVPVAQLRIARDIRKAEAALNETLRYYSSIISTVATARLDTEVGAFAAQEALLRLTKSQQALLDAGGNLARVHGSLLDVQRELGVGDECPPNEPREGGDTTGRLVA
jgi:hypothetical protein